MTERMRMEAKFHNAAASGHQAVTDAAMEILSSGGSAFDAIVAAGFASAVAEPALNSLGGGGFLLARTAAGKELLFDFFVDTPGRGKTACPEPHFFPITVNFPGSDQVFNVGMGSVAVPGNLKGLLHVHRRLCSLPLERILEPAIDIAENGVELNYHQGYFLNLLRPIMTLTERGREIFGHGESYVKAGDRLKNPDLAAFLKSLPLNGADEFYTGEIARRIAHEMHDGDGLLTEQDLASYQVRERRPLEVLYRGRSILTNNEPSLGGPLIAIAMNLLEKLDLKRDGWGMASHIISVCECMKEVDLARSQGMDRPDRIRPEWYDEASHKISGLVGRYRGNRPHFSRGTTHMSVSDADGNVASLTCSNGEGSGYIVPGTGIMLNNMMGEDDLHPEGFHCSEPGIRVSSMMSPSVVIGDSGVELVLGSGGSKRIRTAIMQVMINYLDFGMSVKDAVYAPRIHWDSSVFQVEPGYSQEAHEIMKSCGSINVWDEIDVYFGGVHAVEPSGHCAGDPRRGGVCAVE